MPGAGSANMQIPANPNARCSRRSGALGGHHAEPDALSEGPGWVANTPVCTGGAGEQLRSVFPVELADRRPDLGQLQETGIVPSGGLPSPSRGLWQANSLASSSEGDAGEKGQRGPYASDANEARLCGNCTQSAPDLNQFGGATVFAQLEGCPREKGGMKEGHMGFESRQVRRGDEPRQHNAGTLNRATFQQISAGAVGNLSTPSQRAPLTSVWGRPLDPGRVGGWSPDYREAFPSIRGDDSDKEKAQPREDEGDAFSCILVKS